MDLAGSIGIAEEVPVVPLLAGLQTTAHVVSLPGIGGNVKKRLSWRRHDNLL